MGDWCHVMCHLAIKKMRNLWNVFLEFLDIYEIAMLVSRNPRMYCWVGWKNQITPVSINNYVCSQLHAEEQHIECIAGVSEGKGWRVLKLFLALLFGLVNLLNLYL